MQERLALLERVVGAALAISKWMSLLVLSQAAWACGWALRLLWLYWLGLLGNVLSVAAALLALLHFLHASARSSRRRLLRQEQQRTSGVRPSESGSHSDGASPWRRSGWSVWDRTSVMRPSGPACGEEGEAHGGSAHGAGSLPPRDVQAGIFSSNI